MPKRKKQIVQILWYLYTNETEGIGEYNELSP